MKSSSVSAIVLGTVQLGLRYGVANKSGQPDQSTAIEIVRAAWESGIREFDTAQDYGVSEEVLGVAFRKLGLASSARVISKIAPEIDHCDQKVMTLALEASLARLGVSQLFGLMLHQEDRLDIWSKGLGRILHDFRSSGRVLYLGVSVYSPERALEALNTEGIDMVQVPSNIFDRRFERCGVFELAARKRKLVYVRSVFLQGLILMKVEDLPANMLFARPWIEKVEWLCRKLNLTRHELAVGYLKAIVPEARLVLGVETPAQVRHNLSCWEKQPASGIVEAVMQSFDQVEEKLLNPSLWSRA